MFAPVLRFLRRLRRPAGLGLAASVITVAIGGVYAWEVSGRQGYNPLMRGEFAFRDTLINAGKRAAPRSDLVFLGYDESSLSLDSVWPEELEVSPALKLVASTQGAWPWPRAVQAMILERLAQAGAKLVIFDLVFLGPSPDDERFRAALDRYAGQVVIGANLDPAKRAVTMPSATLIPPGLPPDDRVGYVEYIPDRDGKIHALTFRSTPGDTAGDPVVYESLVARALRKVGRADLIPGQSTDRLYGFRYGQRFHPRPVYEIFVDASWKSNYHDGADFKDKIVLVGPTAAVSHDVHATPLGMIPGPELHLQALTAALNRDFLHSTSRATDLLLIAAAGTLAWLIGVWVRPPVGRTLILLGVGAGYVALAFGLYNRFGLQLIAFTPLLTLSTGGFGGLIGEYVIERAEKARVRGVLDRLVSKDIVRELLADPARYGALVRGERRGVTVLFSDVRGFTSLTEAAGDPAAFIAQLNEYLGEMVDVVFKHRGTLDKFIGDAVMAVWGSIHTDGLDADARAAVAAALEMRVRLAALNTKWLKQGKPPMDIGIGVNHGEVIVGGLGSESSKMEITVMGDAVNLASRLEGLTKEYGLDLLIGETVARRVSETFRLRTVDLVRVKGKKKPSEVMTVLGPLTDVPTETQELLFADYEDAILLYRKQKFAAAVRLLEECSLHDPADILTAFYLERCHALIAQAPAPDWDGVRLMQTK